MTYLFVWALVKSLMESFTKEEVLELGLEGKHDLSHCAKWEQTT